MIKVSVIVPVYNVEKYIGKCLESLVHQTLEDIEIIVVNDGSPDGSQKIIDDYVKAFPTKVRSFIVKNGGQGAARNFGIKHAKGSYIMYVDSDDYVEKDMAQVMYEKAIEEDSDMVVCGNYVVDENYNILKKESCYAYFDFKNVLLNILFGKMAVWNKIYKKQLIVKNNIEFRSKVWYEDVDFTMKAFFKAKKIAFVEEPFYDYLLREGSTMNNNNLKRNLELNLAFDELIDYCKKNKIYKKYYSEIEFLCVYHMYICGMVRVITTKNKMKDKKEILSVYEKYVITHFANFKDNKYLESLDRNKKLIFELLKKRMYRLINFIFYLKRR